MTCPRCRTTTPTEAKFCQECGVCLAAGPTSVGATLREDLERVLGAIARTAARLCDAGDAQINLVEDGCLRWSRTRIVAVVPGYR
jgi:hypothetical protein